MQSAKQIAFAATVGNLLQGWDNGAIAGALLYLKPELGLDGNPILEGIVVGSTLLGALVSTLCSGAGSDWLGRRLILCIAAFLYTISSCVMLWSPSVLVLVLARLLVGAGLGIAVTVVPIYIAEIAPAEIRGQLSTLPQFMGSGGLFLAYGLCFGFSLTKTPNWRLMLALLLAPSLVYLGLALFYLPESPRWLVSKGKMLEARRVLQRLRGKTDVTAELALLVEGLGVGAETSLEEWLIEPAENGTAKANSFSVDASSHVLYTPEEGVSWIAKSSTHQSMLSQRATGSEAHSMSLVDPMVALIGSLNANMQAEHAFAVDEDFDIEKGEVDETNQDEAVIGDLEEPLVTTPLLSRRTSSKFLMPAGLLSRPDSRDTTNFGFIGSYGSRQSGNMHVSTGDANHLPSAGIGGGWQLAWQFEEGQEGRKETPSGFKRVFLLQEGAASTASPAASAMSLPSVMADVVAEQPIQAAALVAQSGMNLPAMDAVGPAMMHPAETAVKGPAWSDLFEVGVRRALVVGVTLQLLQQFSGINAVLYFVPQILQQSGADGLLAQLGFGSESASILGSGVTCFVMLPCIGLAMRLMDQTGRRTLLLVTLPVLFLSLIVMVISSTLIPAGVLQAVASFVGVTVYVCTFVMGFGPIPNILGSEIFPTRVRGVCIGICQATMWTCNILLTNMFPTLLVSLGIGGLFGCFAVVVVIAWVFTFLKVPETKGMPLEVISEFFAMSSPTNANKRPEQKSV